MENTRETFIITSTSASSVMEGTNNNNNLNREDSFEDKQENTENNDFAKSNCKVSSYNSKYNQCNDKNKMPIIENNTENDSPIMKEMECNSPKAVLLTTENYRNDSTCTTSNTNRSILLSKEFSAPLSLVLNPHGLKEHKNHKNVIKQLESINLDVCTTTGQQFNLTVNPMINVDDLKKIIAKKFKITKDRLCVLFQERELQNGSLVENNITESSKIIVTPNCESGRRIRRPENTLLRALESLSESQLIDIISGKIPLIINMRFGEHILIIQLQLTCKMNKNSVTRRDGHNCSHQHRHHYHYCHHHQRHHHCRHHGNKRKTIANQIHNCNKNKVLKIMPAVINKNECLSPTSSNLQYSNNEVLRLPVLEGQNAVLPIDVPKTDPAKILEQSPIKSLSNLVTNSTKITNKIDKQNYSSFKTNKNFMSTSTSLISTAAENCPASTSRHCNPIAANLTSCLCSSLKYSSKQTMQQSNQTNIEIHEHNNSNCLYENHSNKEMSENINGNDLPTSSKSYNINKDNNAAIHYYKSHRGNDDTTTSINKLTKYCDTTESNSKSTSNATIFMEASESLTNYFRNFSNDICINETNTCSYIKKAKKHKNRSDALDERAYSGTFSGKFRAPLQDTCNQPKHIISTVLHMLNNSINTTPPINSSISHLLHSDTESESSTIKDNQTNIDKAATSSSQLLSFPSTSSIITSTTSDRKHWQRDNSNLFPLINKKDFKENDKSDTPMWQHNFNDTNQCNNRNDDCTCSKCINLKTKNKMAQLRLVMQQRKEKRQQRKMKCGPYDITLTTPTPSTVTMKTINYKKDNDVKLDVVKNHP